MRVAFFSPLPPRKSGIADYSAALLERLSRKTEVEVFEETPPGFDASRFDVLLYQLGNNPHHEAVYRAALSNPGVVVLHEFNLHHLIAEITIKREDWDAYLEEAGYDGGPEALARAKKVRALEAGPDYEGVPMMRRVLERARGVIAHSEYVAGLAESAGYKGPIGVIPHGAWIPRTDANAYRHRLGLDELTPVVGIFGFLKPYKRIAESLRAFRRLLRLEPRAKLLLVGEAHPDLDLAGRVRALEIGDAVRRLGFVPEKDFTGYLAACDVVLNLRHPTVGETSGTLLRALGLGKAVLVSDVGAFREFPDEICIKVPAGAVEEDLIFEYLNALVSRRELGRGLGRAAKRWVERNCSWDRVATRYVSFLRAVAAGEPWHREQPAASESPAEAAPAPSEPVTREYVLGWASAGEEGARSYAETHATRLQKTLAITPPGRAEDRILEMGVYMQITPALHEKLGYGEVRGCYYGAAGKVERKEAVSANGEKFACEVDRFDAENDPFPYPNEHFRTVLCCELIEHLRSDPMHMMSEINRVLKPGGHLILTTPNIASLRAIQAILLGYHPGFFPAYLRPAEDGEEAGARHNREYTPKEVARLLIESGFEVVRIETGPFREEPKPEHEWVLHLLDRYKLESELRGDGIYAVGRKTGPVSERYPEWLYN